MKENIKVEVLWKQVVWVENEYRETKTWISVPNKYCQLCIFIIIIIKTVIN